MSDGPPARKSSRGRSSRTGGRGVGDESAGAQGGSEGISGGRRAASRSGGTAAGQDQEGDPYSVARLIALRQLTLGPRTRAQLADTLARRGVSSEMAGALLDRFQEVDLVDDEEFARQWVHTRHTGRGLAPRALAHELSRRGVDQEVVREAVSEISPEDELAAAHDLVRRRLPSMRADDPARRTRRLASMLARKGYGAAVAFQAIRQVCGEVADEQAEAPEQAWEAVQADDD